MQPSESNSPRYEGAFQPTAWTRILRAQDGNDTALRQALDHLAVLYWKPVFHHIRRKGYVEHDAEDLTQEFFRCFIARQGLQQADPAKGKFRTFLLASVNHFLSDEYDKRNAAKRVMPDAYRHAQDDLAATHSFDRDWATVVLDRAFSRLREISPREARVLEAQRGGKTRYHELMEELGATETAVKTMAHRGRTKLRELILAELNETTPTPAEAKEELNALFRALSD